MAVTAHCSWKGKCSSSFALWHSELRPGVRLFWRAQLQPVATEAHVRRALDLFTVSTMDAVKSGAVESVVSTAA